MTDYSEVARVFSYTEEEQNTFPYLHQYMKRLKPHLANVTEDSASLDRFMLAGLFLTYRAFNHAGLDMSTSSVALLKSDVDNQRMDAYKKITGKTITSTREYLKLIHFNPFKYLILGSGYALFRYVLYG